MGNLNGGVLDGIRRIGAKVRELTIDGGIPGVPLGFRLRGATRSGAPQTGTWKAGDLVPDRAGAIWICTAGGTGPAAIWVQVGGSGSGGNVLTRVLWTIPSPGSTHNAAANELTVVSSASGAGTVNLPTGVPAGTVNAVKAAIFGAGNNVTVATTGSDVFNYTGSGITTSVLGASGEAISAQYDGSSIWTIYSDDLPISQVVQLGSDIGGTNIAPLVTSTHLTVTTLTSTTSTQNLNATATRVFVVTQTVATTYTFTSSGLTSGVAYSFELYLNPATFTTTWPAITWLGGGTAPVLTASAVNGLVFTTMDGGTTWYGAAVSDAPSLPVTVPNGGTGASTISAGAVVLGGTSSTSALTTVSGLGTSGYVLTSTGSSSAPTWQAGGGGMGLLATTGTAGYTLLSSGSVPATILTWTTPNDGLMHRVLVYAMQHISSSETLGAIDVSFTAPDGTSDTTFLIQTGLSSGYKNALSPFFVDGNGGTITVIQQSLLTGGAGVLWCEMWGS